MQTGCHTLWPSDVYTVKEDNPYYPTMLKELCEATGATVPHYSRLESCCGMGGMRSTDVEKSLALFREKLVSIKEGDRRRPDRHHLLLLLPPVRHVPADPQERGMIDFEPIPTFYYTQLLALVMGCDPAQVAAISQIDRSAVIAEIQSEQRLIKEVA